MIDTLTIHDVRGAQRMHEALVIKLAPATTPGQRKDEHLAAALWHRLVARHQPSSTRHLEPCLEHAGQTIMLTVPGFRCDECVIAVGLRCEDCHDLWPCKDIRLALDATGLDQDGAVDAYLDEVVKANPCLSPS